jgi:arginine deiminase
MRLKRLGMSHDEHLDFAAKITALDNEISQVKNHIGETFGVSSRAYRTMHSLQKKMVSVKSELDDHYHKVTNEEQFSKAGHVYYNQSVQSYPYSRDLNNE